MNKRLWAIAAAMVLTLWGPSAAFAAKLDPALKRYQEDQKKKLQQEKRDAAAKRRSDPNRRLRPYHTLEELYAELDELAKKYPGLVSMEVYGQSLKGRELKVARISSGPAERGSKPEILFSANIHAQELAGAEFCLALIKKLAEGYGHDCYITGLVNGADIYVIPSLNPDGNAKASIQQSQYGFTGFVRKNEHAVDLNRNYPYPPDAPKRLNDSAGSKYKWMTSYRGPEPLSEPESQALIALIEKRHFLVSMNYHTTGGMIMFPPATFPDPTADDALFKQMANEYRELSSTNTRSIPSSTFIQPSARSTITSITATASSPSPSRSATAPRPGCGSPGAGPFRPSSGPTMSITWTGKTRISCPARST